jgi:TRAP-type C4-dicarboxylate transport system substrate-binding protein
MPLPRRDRLPVVGLLAAAALAAGCGAHADKAGGPIRDKPLVLTMAAHAGDEEDAQPFAATVERLSRGTLQIKVVGDWRSAGAPSEVDYEGGIVADVRAGKAELAVVGARVWDTLGVAGFQALLAPFLIDSLEVERRALETPFVARALAGVARAGVVGVALLPGRLRQPFGITRALVQLHDYRGATIGVRSGVVALETLQALGARAKSYVPGFVNGLDGAELDSLTVTENGYDQAGRALTANVVLWPKPLTIVANKQTFARLTPEQQQLLLAAGREAVGPTLEQAARDQQLGFSNLCAAKFPLRDATTADLARLREAAQPVYERIERNPLTRRWIAQIERVRASVAANTPKCATS